MASRQTRFRYARNEGFVCKHCGAKVRPLASGSYRNHCPRCLWSRHVDVIPGDRASQCCGMMRPIAVHANARRGWMIVHRCTRCGVVRRNKTALGDPAGPDDFDALLKVAGNGKLRRPKGS